MEHMERKANQFSHVLFDLDGTLTDPALGITNSVMYALKSFGIEVTDRTSLYKFIGPPLLDSFHDFYGFDAEKSRLAMKKYREYYVGEANVRESIHAGHATNDAEAKSAGEATGASRATSAGEATGAGRATSIAEATDASRVPDNIPGIFQNTVYEGLVPLLERLRASGRKLYVATSKPEVYAKQILDHFDLSRYFEFCGGSDIEETRVKKAEIISYVIETCGLQKASCIMVGDREHDVIGAKANDIPCIGVLYGFGSEAELTKAGASYLAKTPADVGKVILG
jgi:phosphoglycolate phosphatase